LFRLLNGPPGHRWASLRNVATRQQAGSGGNSSSAGEPTRDGVDVGVGLHMEDHQLPAVPLGIRRSLLGVHLAAVVKVERGREVIDRGNSRAETSFLW
jgi:hypothetical protein